MKAHARGDRARGCGKDDSMGSENKWRLALRHNSTDGRVPVPNSNFGDNVTKKKLASKLSKPFGNGVGQSGCSPFKAPGPAAPVGGPLHKSTAALDNIGSIILLWVPLDSKLIRKGSKAHVVCGPCPGSAQINRTSGIVESTTNPVPSLHDGD
mmetsp:Transcript_52936/g.123713  ORF Transcript_52936/g.123713 Transcript_52936/m.123713 type:complete len:153 (+) Transcript_52936:572-1030(+)